MSMKKMLLKAAAVTSMAVLLFPIVASAAHTSTVTVTPANNQGWAFNRDPANDTPYEFTEARQSIGDGSLYVKPIGPNGPDKFIAEKALNIPVSDLQSIAYDFLIAGNGTPADADQFYLNVYTNLPGSSTFYDCRFDYVPTSGSTTNFTTATFSATQVPTSVNPSGGATCPTTLAGMPSGSTVKFFSLNVGDTSASDEGLAGYLDRVVVNTTGNQTTYDFELRNVPTSRDQCRNGGFDDYTNNQGQAFTNQGQCVSFVNRNSNNNSSSTTNNNNVNIRNNSTQNARSGNANNSGNTTGGSATSGNAGNNNTTTNNVRIRN